MRYGIVGLALCCVLAGCRARAPTTTPTSGCSADIPGCVSPVSDHPGPSPVTDQSCVRQCDGTNQTCHGVCATEQNGRRWSLGGFWGSYGSSAPCVAECDRQLHNCRAGCTHWIEPDDTATDPQPSAAERLTQLKALLDQGLISRGEYDAKRGEILRGL